MGEFEQWFIQQFFFSEEQFNEFFQLENGKYIAKLQDQNVIAYTFRLNLLKLAFDAQQSKIEQLGKENKKLDAWLSTTLKRGSDLEKEKAEITRLVQSLRNEFDLNSDCLQVERQIELLEKACRGEH